MNLDDGDDVYNWPWLYGVEVGHWDLTDQQAAKLRDFLLRGGFFMCDDFHGTHEWNIFSAGMSRVFPDRPIVDIDNNDAIFHTIFDLDDRYQVPGEQVCILAPGLGARWFRGALARHLRRQGPSHGRDLPRHGFGRFLGARRQSTISGTILRAGNSDRRELHRVRDDPLVLFFGTGHAQLARAGHRTATVRSGSFLFRLRRLGKPPGRRKRLPHSHPIAAAAFACQPLFTLSLSQFHSMNPDRVLEAFERNFAE